MSNPTDLTDLELSWDAKTHNDDWGVPVAYPHTFRRLLAEELERAVANGATHDDLTSRAQALRDAPDHWGYKTRGGQ